MTVKDVLQQARDLIQDPVSWIKGDNAVNSDNQWVPVQDPTACAWCMTGAIVKVTPTNKPLRKEALKTVAQTISNSKPNYFTSTIVDFNDDPERTHSEVIETFQKAIDTLKA